jgi:hypothetical protein
MNLPITKFGENQFSGSGVAFVLYVMTCKYPHMLNCRMADKLELISREVAVA